MLVGTWSWSRGLMFGLPKGARFDSKLRTSLRDGDLLTLIVFKRLMVESDLIAPLLHTLLHTLTPTRTHAHAHAHTLTQTHTNTRS